MTNFGQKVKWLKCTKLDQMSRVGSRGRHPKCRPKNISKLLREHILCLFLGLIDYKKKLISEKESKKTTTKKCNLFKKYIWNTTFNFFPTIYAHYLHRWIGKRSSVHKCHTTISWNSYACQINCILGKTRLIWRTSFAFYGRQEAFRWESSQFRFF